MKGKKYVNPATGKYWKRGEAREDGKIFTQTLNRVKKNGYLVHKFASPDAFLKRQIDHSLRLRIVRAKEKGIPVDVDAKYLKDIYPIDHLCPILGIKMEFAKGDRSNSPSIDRIIPSKGYIKGNVVWISDRANRIKQDATSEEIMKVANWLKEHNL